MKHILFTNHPTSRRNSGSRHTPPTWATQKTFIPTQAYIEYYAEENNVDPDLVTAIIDGESNGESRAYNTNDNGTHDKGLMQINSFNYEWLRKI